MAVGTRTRASHGGGWGHSWRRPGGSTCVTHGDGWAAARVHAVAGQQCRTTGHGPAVDEPLSFNWEGPPDPDPDVHTYRSGGRGGPLTPRTLTGPARLIRMFGFEFL